MMKTKRWRVRVKRTIEDWIEVVAENAAMAELEAGIVPGIVHVFPGYTMSGEKPVEGRVPPVGVEDVSDDD